MVLPSRSALPVLSGRSRPLPPRLWYDISAHLRTRNYSRPTCLAIQSKRYDTTRRAFFSSQPRRGNGVVVYSIWERKVLTKSLLQGTSDVRLDPALNKKVWENGVKGVAYRLRIRISRRRNDEEGAKEKLYSYVQAVNVKNPKGLHTVVVEE